MSACTKCGDPHADLSGTDGLCGYCAGAADMRARKLRDPVLWDIAGDREADFWDRQGAYIVLKERGYEMPGFLPVIGEPMPRLRLRVINGGRP